MPEETLKILTEFGIAGLFFVMWWLERKDKANALNMANALFKERSDLISVVTANTRAIKGLEDVVESFKQTIKGDIK